MNLVHMLCPSLTRKPLKKERLMQGSARGLNLCSILPEIAAGHVEELQNRLRDAHSQAQAMQDLLEQQMRRQAEAAGKVEAALQAKLQARERQGTFTLSRLT